jgi:hypothetical protein
VSFRLPQGLRDWLEGSRDAQLGTGITQSLAPPGAFPISLVYRKLGLLLTVGRDTTDPL